MNEQQIKRRLAAILISDVVGYTKMMAADELGTLETLRRHREDVFGPAVEDHDGRVVKFTGDGALVEFPSVVDAVNCALVVQHALDREVKANGAGLVLRIGINLGDTIFDGDDIYGDGVNVAARLEPLAEPGGICLAAIVKESIGNSIQLALVDGGEVSVKNVDRPIRVWKWHPDQADASVRPQEKLAAKTGSDSRVPSIAVLPFDNMSGDPEQEYFSDGLAEDILTDLSKVGNLIVVARNSSFAYKGKSPDLREVGRELGVGAVLEGSIRRAGNRVRITAQLIDTANGAHLWAERYDREMTDIFAVQDDVTQRIVAALKITLTPKEEARLAAGSATNIEAHDLFLRGRTIARGKINRDGFEQAVALLKRAIALDPKFNDAYAGLSLLHVMAYQNRWTADPAAALARAADYAEQARLLAPEDPETFHAWVLVKIMQKDVTAARAGLEKALLLYPNNQDSLLERGALNIATGNPAAAVADIERAMRIDPGQEHRLLQFLGMAHLLIGNYELASAIFRERIHLVPDTDIGRAMLISSLGHLGEAEEAARIWQELKELKPDYSVTRHIETLFIEPPAGQPIIEGFVKAGVPV